jgi:hypothetical protein
MPLFKLVVLVVVVGLGAVATWFVGSVLIRLRWPAEIPRDVTFRHELSSDRKLRDIAELLAAAFEGPAPGNVVCLGPVRGSAARVLFHSGPDNRGLKRNIHRADYVLHVRRLRKGHVSLALETNKPYSYVRIRHSEVGPLVEALRRAFGGMTNL